MLFRSLVVLAQVLSSINSCGEKDSDEKDRSEIDRERHRDMIRIFGFPY